MDKHERHHIQTSILFPFFFVVTLWFIKFLEIKMGKDFSPYGIFPQKVSGLVGILFAPFIHKDISHLFSNSSPIFLLGSGLLYLYRRVSLFVFIGIFFIGNTCVWLFARPSFHIGASGLVYGLLAFIFFSGVIRRERRAISLALISVFLYGSAIWGLFPIRDSVSHEAHLFGGIVGVVFAVLFRKIDMPTEEKPVEELEPEWEEEIWGKMEETEDP
jgi:membrane associated rhomboid family serine protease